ncbi:MAG: hypothetical protein V2G47_07480 [bacterium JZ-2024 1]
MDWAFSGARIFSPSSSPLREKPVNMEHKWLEPLDSSFVVVRAVSSALRHQPFFLSSHYPRVEFLLKVLSQLPPDFQKWGIRLGVLTKGISPSVSRSITLSTLLESCLSGYEGKKYPAVAIGAPSGAVAHLCALLQIPFLTTHFLFSFRFWNPRLSARRTALFGSSLALNLLQHNPCVEALIHFDPVHDRFLVYRLCHIRLRLRCFPSAYLNWLKHHLAPDGRVLLINCSYPWKVLFFTHNILFQIGGLGDIPPSYFIQSFGWKGDWKDYPESEWGTPPAFLDSAREILKKENIPYTEIRFTHPQNFSLFVWKLWQDFSPSSRIFLDSFTFIDPYFHLLTRIPPYWLPFNCRDSLRLARQHLNSHRFESIYLSLPPSFADNQDVASLTEWERLLSPLGKLIPFAISPKFPVDAYAVFRRTQEQQKWYSRLSPAPAPLTLPFLPEIFTTHQVVELK